MASSKDNLKNLMKNSRTRVIILFTVGILVFAFVVALFKLKSDFGGKSSASLRSVPGIQSVPGALNQTPEYAALQNKQNVEQAQKALETGKSAIPTIINMQTFGEGVDVVGPEDGSGGVGFSTLSRLGNAPQKPLWLQDLENSNCDKSHYDSAIANGAKLTDLVSACSCKKLKDLGVHLHQLKSVCDCGELRLMGYSAVEMKTEGYSAEKLRVCGYSACEEKAAGFSPSEMANAGFSSGELKGAGFNANDLAAASGIPGGMTTDAIKQAGCSVDSIKQLRGKGVSIAAIRRISGCSLDQLKAAGATADELKQAGFEPAELLAAGFTPADLRKAGFSADDLAAAGLSPDELTKAGFTPEDIAKASRALNGPISAADIRQNGCDIKHLKALHDAGVSATNIVKISHCSPVALKAAGYTDDDLKNAGFSPEQIASSNALPNEEAIRAAGCDPKKLEQLQMQGVSAAKINALNHCSADVLKAAGYTDKDLLGAGYTPEQLLQAGVRPEDLEAATKDPVDVIALGKKLGCTLEVAQKAKASGMTAADMRKTLGCSPDVLKQAGFSNADLKKAGFLPGELLKAGLSPADLLAAGFSPADLKAAGVDANALKAAGVSAKDLLDAGFSPSDLANAGFGAKDLLKAGVSPADLKKIGFDAKVLKDAGVTPSDLIKAGFTPADLKAAGFDDAALQNAGIAPKLDALASLANLDASKKAIPNIIAPAPGVSPLNQSANQNLEQLNKALEDQKKMQAQQRFQQRIQQKASTLLAYSNQLLQSWKTVPAQVLAMGTAKKSDKMNANQTSQNPYGLNPKTNSVAGDEEHAIDIKTGDIIFAVIDTAVNSDEPGPILATITTGALKGSKLIGTFNSNPNADKMTLTFTTLSIPGVSKTIGISAYAIDPNTGRTALSSSTNHHYVERYGALFASTFLEGFGNAFQSSDTTITIGGNGATTNTTVQNGINRSLTDNAVIALATLGKAWGQQAQRNMNIPTTIQIYSGTAIGVLFLQDIAIAEK